MNIIELAKEAGFEESDFYFDNKEANRLERFAALVRAEALEEAAKKLEGLTLAFPGRADLTVTQCAAAIRGLK